jgi:hypothetical protein
MANVNPSPPDDSSPNAVPRSLEYAKRPSLAGLGRHRRKLVALAIVIALGLGAGPWIYRNWVPLKRRAAWICWSRQAAAFKMPSSPVELVVADPTPADFATTHPEYVVRSPVRPPADEATAPLALYLPNVYRQLRAIDPRLRLTRPDREESTDNMPVAFIGMLRRPDGKPRLVIVQDAQGLKVARSGSLRITVLAPPGLLDPLPTAAMQHVEEVNFVARANAEFKSGVADPNDASHVTFRFTAVEQLSSITRGKVIGSGVVEAHLQNDDSLQFTMGNTNLPKDAWAAVMTGTASVAPPKPTPAARGGGRRATSRGSFPPPKLLDGH